MKSLECNLHYTKININKININKININKLIKMYKNV